MQELKVFLNEAKEQWKSENDKIDAKIDSLIELEKQKLALEREKLEFKKLLFQKKQGTFHTDDMIALSISLFVLPPAFARLLPIIKAAGK